MKYIFVCIYVLHFYRLTLLLCIFCPKGEDSQELPLYMRYAAMPSTDTSLPDMLEHICSFLSAMYEDEIKVKLSMDAYKEAKKVLCLLS